ncbi:4-(cytidine 5'-diphospho)-2-C-methyl-D-erythritol kinase [Leptolyngbya sp. 7M]|uniref:4-(cytidine 5'-diphospho)-2-C-methyl-D-erythritol kinase n=1 Tax=Leptolyngbya sp. 7M TaxID=2812896 RepID=UPI001B8CE612|nr:4-(cytidine 5'-diphospho)-2-C-methyl-D-erythritol kinase [Leptolyngbya sp. 7M]QYO66666.1 4-(cytidine 5'-diphospho)-2-C-methyl-D-erythritol kinase [Leptolyngbya sp. 7M]
MNSLAVSSFAKINFGLRVLGRRNDGFHDIVTVFQTVSLADQLIFTLDDDLRLECSDKSLPTDRGNLIIKAAESLQKMAGLKVGASIRLQKNIPSPGGLGGGSSNAAVTLLALNKIWKLGCVYEDLYKVAASLGSDVPFFLIGGTAIGTGRGTEIEPLPDIRSTPMVLVTPNISVSTAAAFRALNHIGLTTDSAESILLNCRFEAANADLERISLENDFEKPVFKAHPEIERVKQRLLELGASEAALSGSGATVYGSFENEETRQTAMKALGNESDWRSFAVAAISRREYREALKEVF